MNDTRRTSTRRTRKRIGSLVTAVLLGLGLQAAVAAPAQAAPWTWLNTHAGGGLAACKTSVDSYYYGPLWKVHVRLINVNSNHAHVGGVTVRRGDTVTGQVIHSWNRTVGAYAQSDIGTVYLSRILPDKLIAGMGETNGQGSGGQWGMEYLAWC